MRYETIEVTDDGRVATVTLARPDVRNAFNETMIAELTTAFDRIDAQPSLRAVVLAARGPAFCAGADLNWMKKMAGFSDDENRADARRLARMLDAIYRCAKPVIARVHGDAYAGGVGLVAACDIALAAEDVKFCLSEARLGLIPATIAPYVVRAMGERAARRYSRRPRRSTARRPRSSASCTSACRPMRSTRASRSSPMRCARTARRRCVHARRSCATSRGARSTPR